MEASWKTQFEKMSIGDLNFDMDAVMGAFTSDTTPEDMMAQFLAEVTKAKAELRKEFEAKAAQACDQLLRVTNEEGGLPAGLQVPEELQDLVWPLRSAQSAVVRYEASRPRGEAMKNVLLRDGGDQATADRLET